MKVVCENCDSSFKYEIVKDMKCCPVCGASLLGDSDASSHDEPLSFGEDVELGENDSFDEEKIDFWWYKISKPGELGESSKGLTYCTCTSCGHHSSTSYPIAQTKDYIVLDPRAYAKCSNCGKELKNHILSKRPADFVDPRQKEMFVKDYMNMPKCPICSSTKIHKISMTNKAAATITFGVLAAEHVSKTYQCDICKSKF